MPDAVELFEVGPRDGLQNEKQLIPTDRKVELINLLSKAGFKRIEVASFVSPKWVPQMADGEQVLAMIERNPDISYAALTPNMRGFDRAVSAGANEIAIFGSASEGFSMANINCSISESLDRFKAVAAAASVANMKVRGYVSCVTDCPYDGATDPKDVARVAAALVKMGCYEVSLGDTIGKGTPESISQMLRAVSQEIPANRLAGHFHDTFGCALENIQASLEYGLRVFDTSIAGLGGCPYAPGSAGNVATEAVNDFLTDSGYSTGLNPNILCEAAAMARTMRT